MSYPELGGSPRFQPLYLQVKEHLIRQIVEGRWAPGSPLPSETQLGVELGVSQGTVRKALDEMTAEKVVVRRQGRGTFVAEHSQEQALFHFFRLTDAKGNTPIPASEVLGVSHLKPAQRVQELLNLKVEEQVTCIRRVRLLAGEASIYEEVFISKDLFPDIEAQQPLPNTLYTLYQMRYGFSVLKARERVRAVCAGSAYADKLGLPAGAPVLEVERLAFTIDGNPIELRYSFCNTESFAYQVELT